MHTNKKKCHLRQFCAGERALHSLIVQKRKFQESEGVLMIISICGIIVFYLVEWVCGIKESLTKVCEVDCKDRLAFAVPAIPTRHEVTCWSAD